MQAQRRFTIAGGSVGGIVAPAAAPARRATMILAHGAGTDMHHPFLARFADGLAARGVATVRFNFPYTEQGRHRPDPAPILEACWHAVLDAVRADAALSRGRIVIGGKSMGGRMASHIAAQGAAVDGLLFLGYPLHPAGQPHKLRAAHLPQITAPMLFLSGTRDALCPLDRLRPVLAALPQATLAVIDDADHSFAVRKRSGRDADAVMDEMLAASVDWLDSQVTAD
jgi:predicted alpha/beta-hydrolase family hydrolase